MIVFIDEVSATGLSLQVDSSAKTITSATFSSGDICGGAAADLVENMNANFTHTASSINFKISTGLTGSNYVTSFGIRNIVILVDYVR